MPVNGVVDENNRNVFAARRRVYDFRHAYACKVAVALIGENRLVRVNSLYARRNRWRSAVSRLLHVAVEIVIRKYGTAHAGNAYKVVHKPQFFRGFGNQLVNQTVRAAGTIVHGFCL